MMGRSLFSYLRFSEYKVFPQSIGTYFQYNKNIILNEQFSKCGPGDPRGRTA